jgi:hypothetical protein
MGFSRNTPLPVVFGLTSYGGIGLRHLYVEQVCLIDLRTSNTSWQYHPARNDFTRRYIAVSTSAASFLDPRPPPEAVPVPVLLERSRFIRCSLPPTPAEPLHDAIRTPICDAFSDYITTLPLWERDLIAHCSGDGDLLSYFSFVSITVTKESEHTESQRWWPQG